MQRTRSCSSPTFSSRVYSGSKSSGPGFTSVLQWRICETERIQHRDACALICAERARTASVASAARNIAWELGYKMATGRLKSPFGKYTQAVVIFVLFFLPVSYAALGWKCVFLFPVFLLLLALFQAEQELKRE